MSVFKVTSIRKPFKTGTSPFVRKTFGSEEFLSREGRLFKKIKVVRSDRYNGSTEITLKSLKTNHIYNVSMNCLLSTVDIEEKK